MPEVVDLIDPIESVSSLSNGIPPIEDLFIFTELLGKRRERSILTLNSNQNNVVLETSLSNTTVNMLGMDYDENQKNSGKFTTKWTDTVTNTEKVLEGFGIESIEVNMNSSFIPSIKINFVDIRGSAFYNLGENSPYSLLFDFPPPIFELTLKGYYGRSLTYELHLVKHSTSFDSNTGNYYASAEFIARTFAPLTDIPFKLVEVLASLETETREDADIKTQQSSSQDNNDPTNQNDFNTSYGVEPINSYDLIQKLKKLADKLKEIVEASEEAEELNNARDDLKLGEDVLKFIDSFSNEIGSQYSQKAQIIRKNDGTDSSTKNQNDDDGGEFVILNSVRSYRDFIKQGEEDGNNSTSETNRLYVGVLFQLIRNGNLTGDTTIKRELVEKALDAYKEKLLRVGETFDERIVVNTDISTPIIIKNLKPDNEINPETDEDRYLALDITEFYSKIQKSLNTKKDITNNKQQTLANKINQVGIKTLGFKPTIYNIFKVLCNDIDKFFRYLGNVCYTAEDHHNIYFNQIVDIVKETKSKNKTKKLHAFPLYIDRQSTDCGLTREVKAYPDFDGVKRFPETNMVESFIDEMINIKKRNSVSSLKTQVDESGNNKWIPITPADSFLAADSLEYESPYVNLEQSTLSADAPTELYRRLVNRFYIASQYTYGVSFFDNETSIFTGSGLKKEELIRFIGRAEAINVVDSIINDNLLKNLGAAINEYKNNVEAFYSAIETLPNYSSTGDFLTLSDNERPFYRDRSNPDFTGVKIVGEPPTIRIEGNSDSPVDKFIDESDTYYEKFLSVFRMNDTVIKKFTKENIPYFEDYNDSEYTTRYINSFEARPWYRDKTNQNYSDGDYGKSLARILASKLSKIKSFLSGNTYSDDVKAFVLATHFGRARSYFSEYGGESRLFDNKIAKINEIFYNPAVIEVPKFSIYHMGAMVEYITTGITSTEIQTFLNNESWFNDISFSNRYINNDASRVVKLSTNDAQLFKDQYDFWKRNDSGYLKFKKGILNLITSIETFISDESIENTVDDITEKAEELISLGDLRSLDDDIMKKISILNYSEITFSNEDTSSLTTYDPLSTILADTTGGNASRKAVADTFFKAFWNELARSLPDKVDRLNQIDRDFRSVVDDNDIKTQLYYTFKNISDKWIAGIDTRKRGFPLNISESDPLISKFAFVDRAMNPIGNEVVIQAESLIEMSEDFDLNMFQVFSRLLSLNGFEFFPLQNFMVFDKGDANWGDAFKIFTNVDQSATPAFVCMYIGGTASTLESDLSPFDNDGILDLEESGLPDFNVTDNCDFIAEVEDSQKREKSPKEARFKYSEPKAFRVRFGEQNQSFFTNIQMEGREFPETADSLAILSRIAGDGNTTSPVPKGQNLFNLYENRAYTVNVTMLGNMMIQPTQYFQLENIPLYSGAYLITEVKHKFDSKNHAITEFKGVKVLKYPTPYVKDFATLSGIQTGTSDEFNPDFIPLDASRLPNANSDNSPYNNSMFELSISP